MTLSIKKVFVVVEFMLFSITAQTQNSILKNDLKFFLDDDVTNNKSFDLWVLKSDVEKDSNYTYSDTKNRLTIYFKIKDTRGSCKITIIDSTNKEIIKGQFINGLALLSEQGEGFNSFGDGIVIIQKYYRGIIDGEWVFYDLKKDILKKIKYNKGFITK